MRRKIALFSVNELKDIDKFARILIENGWNIVATDLPYNLLKEKGIPVTAVGTFVGHTEKYRFPVTLHPRMEAALVIDDFPERIELVYDMVYGPQDGLDVCGNTLLALAVKGKRIPVTSYESMKSTVGEISKHGDIPHQLREILISKAAKEIADYYIHVAETASQDKVKYLKTEWMYDLVNGENPYQTASLWNLQDENSLALSKYSLISDNKPCYTNLADLDSITEALTKISCAFYLQYNKRPYITIAAKHGNACGIGVDWESKGLSIEKALWGNPMAVWGGEVIVNFEIAIREALLLVSSGKRKELFGKSNWMLDVIAAPHVNDEACLSLTARKDTKLFINKSLFCPALASETSSYRFTRGGVIKQSSADYILDIKALDWGISGEPSGNLDDVLIAWGAAFYSFHGGNEIALSKDRKLLSCAGGPSTLDAAETVVARASKFHKSIHGSSFAADAFFPFTDAPLVLANTGVVCGVVPAGGRKREEVKDLFNKKNVKIGFIPEEYRGFCRH